DHHHTHAHAVVHHAVTHKAAAHHAAAHHALAQILDDLVDPLADLLADIPTLQIGRWGVARREAIKNTKGETVGEVLHSGICKVKTFSLEMPGGHPPQTAWTATDKHKVERED